MIELATEKVIREKVKKSDQEWFARHQYIHGKYIQHPDWQEWNARRNPKVGPPQLTADELQEEAVQNSAQVVEDYNDGDGREMYKTIYFVPYGLYVSLKGTYSSHGDSYWNHVFISEPYEHKEMRYREKSK